MWQRPNLLLLDEPTNHLDIEMRESLAQALVDFEGGLIVVAHDRHLLSAATDQWILVAAGKVAPFDGDLDDYKEWSRENQGRGARGEGREEFRASTRKEERRLEAEARTRETRARKPFEKRLAEIEAELDLLSRESAGTEAWLASSEAYAEGERDRLQAALKRRGETSARIAVLEEDWLWVQAQMESEVNRARE